MFLVETPTWCLATQPLLILLLAYCFKLDAINFHYGLRKMSWVAIGGAKMGIFNSAHAFTWTWWTTIVACIAVLLVTTFVPAWSGWFWLFPAVAAVVHLLLIGYVYSKNFIVK
jgi:hypothetical protein